MNYPTVYLAMFLLDTEWVPIKACQSLEDARKACEEHASTTEEGGFHAVFAPISYLKDENERG